MSAGASSHKGTSVSYTLKVKEEGAGSCYESDGGGDLRRTMTSDITGPLRS